LKASPLSLTVNWVCGREVPDDVAESAPQEGMPPMIDARGSEQPVEYVRTACLALLAAAVLALPACGGDDGAGRTVQTDDTTPPSKLAMDAHVPQPDGQNAVFSLNASSGPQSTILRSLPRITLLVQAEDPESAISDVRIIGETRVSCVGAELSQNKDASWLKAAPPVAQPQFTRNVSLNVTLGRQNPNDRPGPDFIAHCPPDMQLTSVSGSFHASATNGSTATGVTKTVRTGVFAFRWTRAS
jgi:hypothetical protein